MVEVVGNDGTELPAQMVSALPNVNNGVAFGFTVTVKLVVVAQRPAVGVKVYTPEF